MHAYIIYEQNAAQRQQTIQEQLTIFHISKFNCITLVSDGPSIGIAETRLFIRSLSLAPHSGNSTAGIITDAHLLTAEAQQSLLKTLEEPPAHAYIFLGAEHDRQLLPTIASRCVTIAHTGNIVQQNNEEQSLVKESLSSLLAASSGERIRRIQDIGKSKEDIDHWIDVALHVLQNQLTNDEKKIGESSKIRSLIHHLLHAKKYLANNIQPLLLIEHAFLMIK